MKAATVSVFNLKGGVGKTTVTINLAYHLSVKGMKVLVLEMDPQRNLTPVFETSEGGRYTVRDALDRGEVAKGMIYRSRYKNISIIKGDTELVEKYDEDVLDHALRDVKNMFDVILIDCRPSFESLTKNAIYTSDMVLTPVVLDRFCIDNLKLVQKLLRRSGGDIQNKTLLWRIFANKVRGVRSQMAIYQEVMDSDYPVLNTCIMEKAAVPNALAYRKPVVLHQSGSPAALDFMQLANEIGGMFNG